MKFLKCYFFVKIFWNKPASYLVIYKKAIWIKDKGLQECALCWLEQSLITLARGPKG